MTSFESVRQTEERLINAWPGLRTMVCNGWVFRQANGYTKRANSANAIAVRGCFDDTLESARRFYARFDSPTIFRLTPLAGEEPDHILRDLGFEAVDETLVMTTRILDGLAPGNVAISPACTDDWERGYSSAHAQETEDRQSHRAILGRIVPLTTAFATVFADGAPAAFGLGVVERDRLGLFDIVTAPNVRRRGAARRLVAGLLAWGREQGATNAWLSVIANNSGAIALYREFGFAESYRYHYRVAR